MIFSGWKCCLRFLPCLDRGIRYTALFLPPSRVSMSMMRLLSPYFMFLSTMHRLVISIMSAKIIKNKRNEAVFLEKICRIKKKVVPLHPLLDMFYAKVSHSWSVRLSVRTRDFHSLKRSSTLLQTTIHHLE